MCDFFFQTMLASADGGGEETFWTTILVVVLLSSGIGLWSLVKKKTKQDNQHEENSEFRLTGRFVLPDGWRKKIKFQAESPDKNISVEPAQTVQFPIRSSQKADTSKRRSKRLADLQGGLELLDLPFLTAIVANTDSRQYLDIEMRKIAFKELDRRGQLSTIEGSALKVYAKNQEKMFDKTIQCRAISELSSRTKTENLVRHLSKGFAPAGV
jgi:hypothetical protein